MSKGGYAQRVDELPYPDLSSMKNELKSQQGKLSELRSAVPLDAPIKAAEYFVGPGDQMDVSIWSTAPITHTLEVTPEATLLIPNVGVVDVQGLTLEQVKSRVAQVTAKRYIKADISVTLLAPRKITVNIEGMVLNEGKKDVYAVERVDNLIAQSSTFPTSRMNIDEYAYQLNRLRQESSERKIVVRSRNGAVHNVDLVKYQITGDGRYNPYLCEGDNVYVPGRSDKDFAIAVFGGLMEKASFEFVPGTASVS